MSGDELYDDDVTSGIVDLREYADLHRKDKPFACLGCGSREPARLNADCSRCSECELVIELSEALA